MLPLIWCLAIFCFGAIGMFVTYGLGKERGVNEFCHEYFGAVKVTADTKSAKLHYFPAPVSIEPLPVFGVRVSCSPAFVELIPDEYVENAQALAACMLSNSKRITI